MQILRRIQDRWSQKLIQIIVDFYEAEDILNKRWYDIEYESDVDSEEDKIKNQKEAFNARENTETTCFKRKTDSDIHSRTNKKGGKKVDESKDDVIIPSMVCDSKLNQVEGAIEEIECEVEKKEDLWDSSN